MIVPETVADEPTDAEWRRLSELAREVQHVEAEIVSATKALQDLKREHARLTEVDLREAMRSADKDYFELRGGIPVEVKRALSAKQLQDRGDNANPLGLEYVAGHGGAAIVRATITVEFDAEDYESALEVYEMVRAHPSANRMKSLTLGRVVPWNTLTKWVGELIAAMGDPPLDVLGVTERTWVQVGARAPKTVELKGFVER